VKGPRKRAPVRTPREADQLDLIASMQAADSRLREALVTAFSHRDGRVLAAFGQVLSWVAQGRGRR
jgi:hypothetical protein